MYTCWKLAKGVDKRKGGESLVVPYFCVNRDYHLNRRRSSTGKATGGGEARQFSCFQSANWVRGLRRFERIHGWKTCPRCKGNVHIDFTRRRGIWDG